MSTRHLRHLVVALASVALLASGCGGSSSEGSSDPAPEDARSLPADHRLAPQPLAERTTLKVTLPIKVEGFAQVLLADRFGEFEKENLDIELVTLPGTEAVALLSTGKTDVQLGLPTTGMFNAIDQGADIVWAGSNYRPAEASKSGLWINNDLLGPDGEPDPEKVRGANFAFGGLGKASAMVYLIDEWLGGLGLTLDDVNDTKMNGADMLIAMENGAIDGGYILDPFWLELENGDSATFVVDQPDSVGGFMLGSTRHDKGEAIEAFFRAVLRTNELYLSGDYHADPMVLEALAEETEVPAEAIAQTPSLEFEQDLTIDPAVAERIQGVWMELGELQYEEPKALDEFVDQSAVLAARGDEP